MTGETSVRAIQGPVPALWGSRAAPILATAEPPLAVTVPSTYNVGEASGVSLLMSVVRSGMASCRSDLQRCTRLCHPCDGQSA